MCVVVPVGDQLSKRDRFGASRLRKNAGTVPGSVTNLNISIGRNRQRDHLESRPTYLPLGGGARCRTKALRAFIVGESEEGEPDLE
jgi:hypothetical protein